MRLLGFERTLTLTQPNLSDDKLAASPWSLVAVSPTLTQF